MYSICGYDIVDTLCCTDKFFRCCMLWTWLLVLGDWIRNLYISIAVTPHYTCCIHSFLCHIHFNSWI